jgi:L-fuconolactonase
MKVFDAQIHVWDEDGPRRPWDHDFAQSRRAFLRHGPAMTTERAIASMDAVGVNAALATTFMLYPDISYAASAAAAYPDRIRVVAQLDLRLPDLTQRVRDYIRQTALAAIRLSFLTPEGPQDLQRMRDGGLEEVFQLAGEVGLPIMLLVSGNVLEARPLARRFPDLRFAIDHLGIVQGQHRDQPDQPFARNAELLSLAQESNIYVKLTGAACLSKQQFPYHDLWPGIRSIVNAFGPQRVMWGSDFSRTRPLHSYADALGYVRYTDLLTEDERRWVLAGTLREFTGWPP